MSVNSRRGAINEFVKKAKDSIPNLRDGEKIIREWYKNGVYFRETALNGDIFLAKYNSKLKLLIGGFKMNELQLFNYEGQELRTVLLDDVTWWVVKDICKILGIIKYRDAIARLDEDERGSVIADTLGGSQKMVAVNESGLYHLIFQSRKPGSYTAIKNEPPEEELSAAVEMQKASLLARIAEHKAVHKKDQLKLLNIATKILTGVKIDTSTVQDEPQKVVSLMKLPEVICRIKNGSSRNFGEITIKFYSLLEIADILGIAPVNFDKFADNYNLKNDGHYGMWERVAIPSGDAREFTYCKSAIQKYKSEVKHKC